MQHINQDIKTSQFNQIYLLYGEEDYLRCQYRDKLSAALLGDGDSMNLTVFTGKDFTIPAIIDIAETLPFFSDRRVIVLDSTGVFKTSADVLVDYLKNPSPSTHFIFTEKEIDKRSKLYKAIKAKGYISEFKRQDENTLRRWVKQLFSKEGKEIDESALAVFLNRTGSDMSNIRTEVEKLVCYCYESPTILRKDVEAVTTEQLSNQIFDMIRAVAEKNQKQALSLYYDLLALKEPPMRILALLARQFHMLFITKGLADKGFDNRVIGEKVGLAPFIAAKYRKQCGSFKSSVLKKAVEDCVIAEEEVKTGKLNDRISVELLIIKYSSME